MAAGIFQSAAAQVALEFGLTLVEKSCKHAYDVVYKGSNIKELGETVNGWSPAIDEMYQLTIASPSKEWIQNIQQTLTEAKNLVNASGNTSILGKFGEAGKAQELQDDVNKSMQNVVLPNMVLDQTKLMIKGEALKKSLSILIRQIQKLTLKQETMHEDLKSTLSTDLKKLAEEKTIQISRQDRYLCSPPPMPKAFLGFDEYVVALKELVLQTGKDVVGVTAIGGAGKSALVTALCHDPEIQEYFKERIIYIAASKSQDLPYILKIMWKNIVGGSIPHFTNVEDTYNKLQQHIESRRNDPILVVLDDIWKSSDLDKLLFKGERFVTLVTTRDKKIIKSTRPWFNKGHYQLPALQETDALKFFCLYAFNMSTIPDTHDEELVMQVQAECKGLPLALQVIGSSLNGEPYDAWEFTRDALASGEAPEDDQIEVLLERLKTSIDVLSLGEKQCFLDLAIFPKGRNIPANVLLDIWVCARGMKRDKAVHRLRKFDDCHLLDLKRDSCTSAIKDDCMNNYFFSLHDVMRHLALFLAEQDKISMRLCIPQEQCEFSPEWDTDTDHSSEAQIVSIHTGTMKDTQWPKMKFPQADVLVLYFTATEYCIPTFLDKMTKLKVLIIHNENAKQANLDGVAGFKSLSKLKALHLERLIVPPIHEDCKGLMRLEKVYLRVCEGLDKIKEFNLPKLLEFNVDNCSDLEKLSAGICFSKSLEILSITRCHSLRKLPDDLSKLGSLKVIRLCQSPGLKALPPSICSLGKLELLNISSCIGLKVNTSESPELEETLQSLAKLASLKKVICDEYNEYLFRQNPNSRLKVEAVKEDSI